LAIQPFATVPDRFEEALAEQLEAVYQAGTVAESNVVALR
jgi:hypothetical protein